ncbi:matrixin family metalloprotease [Nocardioides sp. TRM66260-LWL]|uniref:matrixin family metalloprotease n=1 Tax=Nocardioides sp. TRM66260-LWL TaxID=2874478 RepID=UPI001CC591A8|nr:matrixin family metalloprotease [Nocardioides sp. TRM66260-LWL]MBZ5734466.1 matrixin family metalloprotease [Nocardioides sp. TRM66260-LWL]
MSPTARDRRRRALERVGPIVVTLVAVLGLVAFAPGAEFDAARRLVGLGPGRLGAAPDVPDAGRYAFLTEVNGQPVGYDPCRPIRYEVNPAGAPDGWPDLVARSIATIEQATGLRFEDDGTTTDRDFFQRRTAALGRPLPVLIGWADASENRDLDGDVAGLGGSSPGEPSPLGRVHYVTGSVLLDQDAYARLAARPDGAVEMQGILTHELGHLVGLDHVEDPRELMNPSYVGQRGLGPGDRAGLARLGALPCG